MNIRWNRNTYTKKVTTPFQVEWQAKIYTGQISIDRNAFLWNYDREKITFEEEEITDSMVLDEITIVHDNTLHL